MRHFDERFYALNEVHGDALTQRALQFIRDHPDDFAVPGK